MFDAITKEEVIVWNCYHNGAMQNWSVTHPRTGITVLGEIIITSNDSRDAIRLPDEPMPNEMVNTEKARILAELTERIITFDQIGISHG